MELMSERMGALEYEHDQMKAAFQHFDKDNSGKLSREELRRFLTSNFGEPLTEEEFSDVMNDMDVDGDGQVDLEGEILITSFWWVRSNSSYRP